MRFPSNDIPILLLEITVRLNWILQTVTLLWYAKICLLWWDLSDSKMQLCQLCLIYAACHWKLQWQHVLFSIYGWAGSQPRKEDFTYAANILCNIQLSIMSVFHFPKSPWKYQTTGVTHSLCLRMPQKPSTWRCISFLATCVRELYRLGFSSFFIFDWLCNVKHNLMVNSLCSLWEVETILDMSD